MFVRSLTCRSPTMRGRLRAMPWTPLRHDPDRMESRRPIDVLTDCSAKTLRIWLQTLLDIEIMCRDRADPYSGGVASGEPVGFQVADRWHIWENLGDALEHAIAPRRHCLTAAAGCLDDAPATTRYRRGLRRLASWSGRARSAPRQGRDPMPAAFRRGPGIIYEFKPYLLSGGIRDAPDAALLFDAITACGYRSQPNLVRAHQAFLDAAHITGPQL